MKKLACFYELQFVRILRNILLSDSVLETKKTAGKIVKFDSPRRTISVCKLLLIVNFDGFTFLTALVLLNQ